MKKRANLFTDFTVWVSVGLLALALGGASGLDTVLAKNVDDEFLMLMAARNAVKAGKYETAIGRYEKLLKMPGTHLKARLEFGWVLTKARKYQAGQRQFDAVLKADPNNVNALRGRLEGARQSKNRKVESETLSKLVRLDSKDRELRKQLALVLHNQGKYEEAEQHLAVLLGSN